MPPYGRLEITVTGDTRALEQAIAKSAQGAGQQAAQSIGASLAKGTRNLTGAIGKAAATGLTIATGAAIGFGVASFRTAARVSTMDKALQAMAKANNTSYKSMQSAITGMRRQGITTQAAQSTVASFTRGQLDLRKAQDLARVAQDAATVTGRDQNQVVSDLTRGIMTQNVRLLRNAGVSVDVKKAQADYAAQLGISVKNMTSAQKAQAVLNGVLTNGRKIAGAYAAAMREPGRVLQQFPTIIAGIRESVGQSLLRAFGPVVVAAGQFATSLSRALVPGGQLAPIMDAVGGALVKLVGPLTSIIEKWARWIDNLKPDQVNRIADAVKRFGPMAAAAALGLTAMTAPSILRGIPGVGGVIGNLAAPLQSVGGLLTGAGKAAAGMVPGLRSIIPGAEAAAGGLGGMAGPLALIAAGFALLMAVSPEFRAAVMEVVSALGQALQPVLKAVVDAVKILIPPLITIAQVFGSSLAQVLLALVPILNTVAQVLTWLQPVLPALVIGILAWTAAQWLLNAALAANPITLIVLGIAALVAGVIIAYQKVGWFRGAVQALGSAFSAVVGWARSLAQATRGAFDSMMLAWTSFIGTWTTSGRLFQGTFMAVWEFLKFYLSGVARVLFTPIRAAGDAFSGWWATNGDLVKQVWASVVGYLQSLVAPIVAVFGFIGVQLAALGNLFAAYGAFIAGQWRVMWAVISTVASIAWLTVQTMVRIGWAVVTGIFQIQLAILTAVWRVAWAVIQAVFQIWVALVTAVLKVFWNVVVGLFTIGLNLITGNWRGAWTAMLTYGQQIWNAILGAVRAMLAAVLGVGRASMAAFSGLWTTGWNTIRNTTIVIGTAIQNWISGLWARILAGARSAWTAIVQTISTVWNRVRDAVAGPARWVVSAVINPLIRGINTLITKVGISAIPQIPAFHSGGKVPGHGPGDRQIIAAEAGEWVLTKRQARGIGYGRLANLPRYQTGGLVGNDYRNPEGHVPPPSMRLPNLRDIGGAFARITHIDALASAGRELFDSVLGMLTYAAAVAFEKLTDPLKKLVEPWTKDAQAFPRQWLGKVMVETITKAVEWIKSKAMGPCGDIGLGGGNVGGIVGTALKFNGRPYRWGGPANPSQGFDCSSFVSYVAGINGLPLPGGFRVPSSAHGPVTTDYLSWAGMRSKPLAAAKPGDVAVNARHIGFIIGPGGSGFAARSTATGIGPQNFARGYTYREWLARAGAGSALPDIGGGICGSGVGQSGELAGLPVGVRNYAGIVQQVAQALGMVYATNAFLAQMATESGGNPRAINNWDINARRGTPSKGLLQVIDPTFAAYCGPYCSRGIWDPLANIYAAMNYAKSRYGSRLLQVIGRGRGYAAGGIIGEPVVGLGLRSGVPYSFGERGPELVSPLSRPGVNMGSVTSSARAVINVYPSAGMNERALAAMVSRELAWAEAGGRT